MQPVIRRYSPNDLERIVALLNAAEAIDHTEDGTSIEELRVFFQTPDYYPEQNVFVAEAAAGQIVGYANMRLAKEAEENSFRTWFQVHPEWRGGQAAEGLLARLYARAGERMAECDTAVVWFDSFANLSGAWRTEALERFGMRQIRQFWQMVRPNLEGLEQPKIPPGITFRTYRVKEDDMAIHAVDAEVFRDHWGHTEEPFEHWLHYVAWSAFKPNLTVIAEDAATGAIAGYCTILINAEENARLGFRRGWIDILGVRRPYRQHGLGTALLLTALRNLKESGVQQAALGADAENLTGATRIYARVGFAVSQTRAVYRKKLRG